MFCCESKHSLLILVDPEGHKELDAKVDNLDPAEDGEAGEKPHGATNQTKCCHSGDLDISVYHILSGCVHVDLNDVQWRLDGCSCKYIIRLFLG